ncbi:MAG: hypothetical protein A2Z06_01535 [Candidatus Glassbacteria bacterium RBG_16_58_8]|uniref:Uncharacterized protein n=1 Tax=Candidatus Glassbacteria bacterium RBG_16_58_8 TaxID=1817866 RepID=A0A1F5YAL4_9BACT|nr:MAG: hypothetical protein A2Z06_01535 [Candidatus Glassbacteria bacterium RBG_16_58_8]
MSPAISSLRKLGPGWYVAALKELRPDFIVEYTRSLEENVAEGSGTQLFMSPEERRWFNEHYRIVRRFESSGQYPNIDEKEKRYTLLKSIRSRYE